MSNACTLLAIIGIIAACTCGVRTECPNRVQISVLTAVHDDPACKKVSTKGVLLFEAAKLLVDTHNNKTNGYKIETTVLDTCGSLTGAVKSAMKALVWADINCLNPPYYLGIIGPDTATNADAVHKITSVLGIPHIVRKPSTSPYLHHLAKESDGFIAQGILKVMEALKWKSFTLVADGDEDNEDDVQNIAKKLTAGAIAKGLCVMVHDNDEEDLTSQIVHIGKPSDALFRTSANATILIASEGNIENYLNRVNSSNTIILLEDARGEYEGLEARVEKSRWWNGDEGVGKYDDEELREVRWLEDAIKVYTKGLDTLCKKKKCKNSVNPAEWNKVLSNIIAAHNSEIQSASRTMNLAIKAKSGTLERLGSVKVTKNSAKIDWRGGSSSEEDDDENSSNDDNDHSDDEPDNSVPESFARASSMGKEKRAGCATTTKEIKMMHAEDDDEAARVLLTEMDESEWWTMVGTVSGVGVAMFVVGILAVYVVYSNIRGPRTPKNKGRGLERDTSLRRVGSERETPAVTRNQRNSRGPQRRDSNRSIRSNISDKSV